MKFDVNWIPQILAILPSIIAGVDSITKTIGKPDNTTKVEWDKARQDAAMSSIGAMISSLELVYGREIFADPEFQTLVRKLIDDYIALDNYAKRKNVPVVQ